MEASSHGFKPAEVLRLRALEFEVSDLVFLMVMLKKGVVRFGKQASRYIRPFRNT